MPWYIVKRTRVSDSPYIGPSCAKANVKPGRTYEHRGTAQRDARRLSKVNPVGFDVKELKSHE